MSMEKDVPPEPIEEVVDTAETLTEPAINEERVMEEEEVLERIAQEQEELLRTLEELVANPTPDEKKPY